MSTSFKKFCEQNPHIPTDIAKQIHPMLMDMFVPGETKVYPSDALAVKLQSNAEQVREYIVNSSDLTLSFLQLTNQQRDNLAKAHIDTSIDDDDGGASVLPLPHTRIHLFATSKVAAGNDADLYKIMAHEFGHWLEFGGKGRNTYPRRNKAKVPRFLQNIDISEKLEQSHIPAHLAGFIAGIIAGSSANMRELTIPIAAISYAIGKHLHWLSRPALYMHSRYMEQRADLFSDKIVPEVTFKQLVEHTPDLQPSLAAIEEKPIGRIVALFDEHPSLYTRYQNSERNCAKFLQYKKDNNIPSLIQP